MKHIRTAALLAAVATCVVGLQTFTVDDQDSCATGEYYSTASFSCIACDSTQEVSDTFSCVCSAGYVTTTTNGTTPCTACPYASSSNRLFCMSCDSTTSGFDTNTSEYPLPAAAALPEPPLAAQVFLSRQQRVNRSRRSWQLSHVQVMRCLWEWNLPDH